MRTIHCPAARASLSLDVGAWLKRLASGPSACTRHNHMAAAGPHPDPQRPEAEQPLLHSAHTTCTCVQTTTLALRSRASRNCTPHGHRSCTSFTLCNVCSEQQAHSYSKAVCAVRAHAHADALRPQTFNRLVSVPIRASLPCLSCSRLALVPQTVRSPTCDLCPSAHARHGSEEHRPNSRAAEMYIRTVFLPPCPCLSSGATPRKTRGRSLPLVLGMPLDDAAPRLPAERASVRAQAPVKARRPP